MAQALPDDAIAMRTPDKTPVGRGWRDARSAASFSRQGPRRRRSQNADIGTLPVTASAKSLEWNPEKRGDAIDGGEVRTTRFYPIAPRLPAMSGFEYNRVRTNAKS